MTSADEKIAELERERLAVEEMLFLVLDAVGEPVEVTVEAMHDNKSDRMIDIQFDEVKNSWVFKAVTVTEQ